MRRKSPKPNPSATDEALVIALELLTLDREVLDAAKQEPGPPEIAKLLELALLALELAIALSSDLRLFAELEMQLEMPRLIERLLELPLQLSDAGKPEVGLAVATAFQFIGGDLLRGDEALILAREGRREEALALVASNLSHAKHIPTAEAKAGDVYRALGESDAAEAYYRRALAVSKPSERSEAVVRLVSLLSDAGREADAASVLREEEQRAAADTLVANAMSSDKVGRNDPCPCGSGKKYKKCHGAGP